jgi:beta-xylosidase
LGAQWAFFDPAPGEMRRVTLDGEALVLQGKGSAPRDSSPLTLIAGDQAYEVEVEMEIGPGAVGGLVLFYSDRLYAGLGSNGEALVMHRYGEERPVAGLAPGKGGKLWLRLRNDRHIVTLHHSRDGRDWEKYGVQMEVSGYHHNVAGKFLSLRPGLYASGRGQVRFLDFRYRALD